MTGEYSQSGKNKTTALLHFPSPQSVDRVVVFPLLDDVTTTMIMMMMVMMVGYH